MRTSDELKRERILRELGDVVVALARGARDCVDTAILRQRFLSLEGELEAVDRRLRKGKEQMEGRGVKGYHPDVEWRAHLRSGEIPGDPQKDLVDLADRLIPDLGLEEFGPVMWTTDRAVGLTVSTDEPQATDAMAWAQRMVADFQVALARVGHPVGVAHVEVEPADAD
jgi:hypothetical protein